MSMHVYLTIINPACFLALKLLAINLQQLLLLNLPLYSCFAEQVFTTDF